MADLRSHIVRKANTINTHGYVYIIQRRNSSVNLGGGGYSYIRVMPDEFLLKSVGQNMNI